MVNSEALAEQEAGSDHFDADGFVKMFARLTDAWRYAGLTALRVLVSVSA